MLMLRFKEGWKELSPDARTMLSRMNRSDISNTLCKAVVNEDSKCLSFMLRHLDGHLPPPTVYSALSYASKYGKVEAIPLLFDVLIKAIEKGVKGYSSSSLHYIRSALSTAASGQQLEAWQALCTLHASDAKNKGTYNITDWEKGEIAFRHGGQDFAAKVFPLKDEDSAVEFAAGIVASCFISFDDRGAAGQDLRSAISFCAQHLGGEKMQKALGRSMHTYDIFNASADLLIILLDKGAVVDAEIVKRFIKRDDYRVPLETALSHVGPEHPFAKDVEEEARKKGIKLKVTKTKASGEFCSSGDVKIWSSNGKDTLIEKQNLPDGGYLTVMFNFSLRQQMVFVTSADKMVSPVTVTGFDDIPATDAIADAGKKLVDEFKGDAAIVERALPRRVILRKEGGGIS